MLVLLCGLPGPALSGCAATLCHLLTKEGRSPIQIQADTVSQVAAAAAGKHQHVGIVHHPDAELGASLRSGTVPVIFAPLAPEPYATDLIATGRFDRGGAVRQATLLCASLIGLREKIPHIDIPAAVADGAPAGLARFLAEALDRELTEAGRQTIAAGVACDKDDLQAPMPQAAADDVVRSTLHGYACPGARQIGVAPELLFTLHRAVQDACGTVDISGAAHCLVFGPFFHLPPGLWTGCYTVTFSPDCVGRRFLVDATALEDGALSTLARAIFRPIYEDCFTVAITFRVASPAAAIELRLHSGETLSSGTIEIHHVNFMRAEQDGSSRQILGQNVVECFSTSAEFWSSVAPGLATMARSGGKQPVFRTVERFEDQNCIAYEIAIGSRHGIALDLSASRAAAPMMLVESPQAIGRRGYLTPHSAQNEALKAATLYVKLYEYRRTRGISMIAVSSQKEFATRLGEHLADPERPLPPRDVGQAGSDDPILRVAEQMFALALGDTDREIVWPGTIFRRGDNPQETSPSVIDLVGPSRVLFTGPYLNLPAGSWDVTLQVHFDAAAVRREFTVQVLTDTVLVNAPIRPRDAGSYRWCATFVHDQPDLPVSILMVLERGAIEGQITLHGAALRLHTKDALQPLPC